MSIFNILIQVFALVFLFLFSVKKFSHQVERIAGDRFKQIIRTATSTPLRGTVVGAGVTALIHSSTAVTVMAVSLVNANIMSFYNSLGIVFGANIGTTITAQLYAFNIGSIAPYFVVIGFILNAINTNYKKYGKIVFYFGVLFLSLDLITSLVAPLQSDPRIVQFFTIMTDGYSALVLGIIFSVLFQSSTITTSIAMILAGTGVFGLHEAVLIILGANIGTTSTGMLSAIPLDRNAKKTAMAHFLFNVICVFIFLPLLKPFYALVQWIGGDVIQQISTANILFNLLSIIIFLPFVSQFAKLIDIVTPKRLDAKEIAGIESL